jgi:GntR family transcriptional regulator
MSRLGARRYRVDEYYRRSSVMWPSSSKCRYVVPESAPPEADPRKYVRLALLIHSRILDGTLRPGDPAPSITALAAEHGGWARQTCAKALQTLEAEGLLLRVRGLGYFINSPASTQTDRTQQAPILRVADLLNSPRDDG